LPAARRAREGGRMSPTESFLCSGYRAADAWE
jgi:hypothetical protein